jgi:antitoxin HicB
MARAAVSQFRLKMNALRYPVTIAPLPEADGGGFVATVPDLPGCMSDGASPQEALVNVSDAIAVWIEAAGDVGHEVPQPAKITRRREP